MAKKTPPQPVLNPEVPKNTGIYPGHRSSNRTMTTHAVHIDDLLVWARSRHTPPTADDIRTRFSCSRATSFRWLRLVKLDAAERHIYKESANRA
jgi:hypothetical protein